MLKGLQVESGSTNLGWTGWVWTLAVLLLLSHFSRVWLCATPSLGFSRQEHCSGLPFPSPMHESEKWKWSRSVMSDSLRPHGLQPTRLLSPWDFPGKSTGVRCHCLLHSGSQLNSNGFNVSSLCRPGWRVCSSRGRLQECEKAKQILKTQATCTKYSNSPLAEKASFMYTNFNLLSSLKWLNLYLRSRCQHLFLVSPLFPAYIWLPSHHVLTWPFLCLQKQRNTLLMSPLIIIMTPLLSG